MIVENIFLQLEKYFQARAATEEREMRLGDVHKTLAEFQRDIVGGAVHPRTGVYMAEKVTQSRENLYFISPCGQVTKWLEDNCRAKAHQVEKIRVSIGSVRADIRRLSLAAQQLAEKGEDDADQVTG